MMKNSIFFGLLVLTAVLKAAAPHPRGQAGSARPRQSVAREVHQVSYELRARPPKLVEPSRNEEKQRNTQAKLKKQWESMKEPCCFVAAGALCCLCSYPAHLCICSHTTAPEVVAVCAQGGVTNCSASLATFGCGLCIIGILEGLPHCFSYLGTWWTLNCKVRK